LRRSKSETSHTVVKEEHRRVQWFGTILKMVALRTRKSPKSPQAGFDIGSRVGEEKNHCGTKLSGNLNGVKKLR